MKEGLRRQRTTAVSRTRVRRKCSRRTSAMRVIEAASTSTTTTATRKGIAIASAELQTVGTGRTVVDSLCPTVDRGHRFDSGAGGAARPFAAVVRHHSVHHFEAGLLHRVLLVVVHRTPSDLSFYRLHRRRTSGVQAIGEAVADSIRRSATRARLTARTAPR